MKKLVIGIIVSFLLLVAIGIGLSAYSYISAYNYGNSTEAELKARHESSKNILSSVSTTVSDNYSIFNNYRSDVKEIVRESMRGRYGEDGMSGLMTFVSENNIQLDASIYKDISRTIQAGRQDFRDAQNRMIDVKRSYESSLGSFFTGFWLRLAGYPKIDLDDYKILLDESTRNKFESGIDSGFLDNTSSAK